MTTVSEKLDRYTATGELYEKLENGAVRCFACAHRCRINPGKRGVCQVRFNQNGELRVPWGYVAAAQLDPIEKKPFSHFLPGSDALTYGMLGCDFHCGYCFTGDTVVLTDRGPISLQEAFDQASFIRTMPDGEIAYCDNLCAVTEGAQIRPARAIFRHPYKGKMMVIQPYYLPEIQCTPDHKVYATTNPDETPHAVPAGELTPQHYLVVPRNRSFSGLQNLDAASILGCYETTHKIHWKLTEEERVFIQTATENGLSSRQIGQALSKSGSYIRHVRSKMVRNTVSDTITQGVKVENGFLRFSREHRPGVPANVTVDENFGALLGYYCAEGSVVESNKRPNSRALNFSLSLDESEKVNTVLGLLQTCFHGKGRIVRRSTTLCAATSKTSLALLLSTLAGVGAQRKQVPDVIFKSPRPVVEAFINAYIAGDGHRYANGKVSVTTVSKKLAYGVAWLVLKLGFLPSVYKMVCDVKGSIQGREINRAPYQYTIVWYENSRIPRNLIETEENFLIPLRKISQTDFEGNVYNMEVEETHKYLAGFALVSNCQNWLTSQTLRDPEADMGAAYLQPVTADDLVSYAVSSGAKVMVSSYNEPLITSEWSAAIFQKALAAGLKCAYVSNGNATPEVLRYLRPYLSAYKVDLKTMQDKQYRKLGGVLQNVLDTIQAAHDLGLWVEVVTLVVPGFNDSPAELWDAARFLTSVSPDIPWHVTAYHPDYRMEAGYTTAESLQTAVDVGQEAGLRYVYAGNLPGRVGSSEHTFCPHCAKAVIRRSGFVVQEYALTAEGKCPSCGTVIPGIWTDRPETVRTGRPGWPRVVRL